MVLCQHGFRNKSIEATSKELYSLLKIKSCKYTGAKANEKYISDLLPFNLVRYFQELTYDFDPSLIPYPVTIS